MKHISILGSTGSIGKQTLDIVRAHPDEYKVVEKGGRFFAVAKSNAGTHECWRVLSKDQAAKLK